MDDLDKYLNERLEKDEEFKKIWQEDTIKREVLKMLLKMRVQKGLTQKELAQQLGTTRSMIARLESGNVNPSINFLIKLGKAFNKKLELHYIEMPPNREEILGTGQ